MRRPRRTQAQWLELIARQQASGLSATAFCAENGVNLSRFYKRRRQLKQASSSEFVPVRVQASTAPITIQIADVTVRCSSGTPAAWIAELAACLR